jgi:hypothetical protein
MEEQGPIRFTDKKVDESWKDTIEKEKKSFTPSHSGARPPLSFHDFLNSLGMQAFIQLGELDHPVTKKKEKDVEAAKETIDLLVLLKEKTQGNLTARENDLLAGLIADLQLRYVEAVR